jgi:U3 small nucleolar RNA-associated protein 21
MELLVTTHVEQRGLSTWANQSFFGSSDTIIASNKPISAQLPSVALERFRSKKSNVSSTEKDHRQMLLHSRQNGEEESSESSEDSESSLSLLSENEISASDSESMEAFDDEAEAAPAVSERDQQIVSGNAPVAPEMITLSMLPRSQWINLVHIDTIKLRNKPIEPPKKPEAAPFFLPTVSGANAGRNPVFAASEDNDNDDDDERIRREAEAAWGADDEDIDHSEDKNESRLLRSAAMVDSKRQEMDSLGQALLQYKQSQDWKPLLEILKASKPSKVDIWLRQMEILDDSVGEHEELLLLFISFLEHAIASDTEFQFLQALLRATILIHGESISAHPSLQEAAKRVEDKTNQAWSRISSMLDHVQCLVGILGSMHA